MVDIPALVKNRMHKAPIEFWKPGEIDKLRRATWIYEPAWEVTDTARRMSDVVSAGSQMTFEVDRSDSEGSGSDEDS